MVNAVPIDLGTMTIDVPSEPSDEELLVRVARREADALTALYDRHRSIAYGVALRVTRSVPIAEDAVQEAFLGLWRQGAAFDPRRGSGRSWLLAIVRHRAIDLLRRRRSSDPLPDASLPLPEVLVSPDIWPEVAGRLDAAAIRTALSTLSEVQREAIELAYWGGLSQSEIATKTSVPLGTVKGRLRLGLLALGRALSGTDAPGPDSFVDGEWVSRRPDPREGLEGAATDRSVCTRLPAARLGMLQRLAAWAYVLLGLSVRGGGLVAGCAE